MRILRPRSRARSRGVSLIEVLVGSALSLMALATVLFFFQAQQRALAAQSTYVQSQVVTRTVVDLLARELRMAGYDPMRTMPATVAACPENRQAFLEGTPTRIRFRQDLNGDGDTDDADDPAEDLVYELVGNEVRRRDWNTGGGPVLTLVSGVPQGGLRFRYFNNANVELVPAGSPATLNQAGLDCISRIRFSVRAELPNPDPRINRPVTSVGETAVAIRNRALLHF